MKKILSVGHLAILKYLIQWTLIILPVAITIGSMVSLFLWLLHQAIDLRFQQPWLLYLLPAAGLAIHVIYRSVGKSSEKGNNLIVDEIHEPGAGIPARMGPIVLVTTIITHLFGGSAGREGTAVQIGGSIAEMFSKWFKLDAEDRKTILTAGVAAGFGAVFGTPLTGAVFAMEVLTLGRIQYNALLPCLMASTFGDLTVAAWGIEHTTYHIDIMNSATYVMSEYLRIDVVLLLKVICASAIFGMAGFFFSTLVHALKNFFNRLFSVKWIIPLVGGSAVIGLTWLLGKPDYLSLGVDAEYAGAVTIQSAFHTGGADQGSWFWKTIYTSLTLATGFKGGEVTPLFYVGATLGNTLSELLHAPVSLFAALGFIAVFSGATNTPLACTIMGVELFGGEYVFLFAVACFTAYIFSGDSGIYRAQRLGVPKIPGDPNPPTIADEKHEAKNQHQ